MAWSVCAWNAEYDYRDPQTGAVVYKDPYGYPPIDTQIGIFCDIPDLILALFLFFMLTFTRDHITRELGLGKEPVWGRMCLGAAIFLGAAAVTRLVLWSIMKNLVNRHATPAGVHTNATGVCMPRFTYIVSSIGYFARVARVPVIAAAVLGVNMIALHAGRDVMKEHHQLFDGVRNAAWLTGLIAFTGFALFKLYPSYLNNPYVNRLRTWSDTKLGAAYAATAGREALERTRAPELANPQMGWGHAAAGTARDVVYGRAREEESRRWSAVIIDVVWIALPGVVALLFGAIGGLIVGDFFGGVVMLFFLGLYGAIGAVLLALLAGIVIGLGSFGFMYTFRAFWRTWAELIRWLFARPQGPYPVSV